MQRSEQEVTLQVKSRPLKLVYLVRNQEDIVNAVTLYTHIWGGAANIILPIPENDTETSDFKQVLKWINPDYIFYTTPKEEIDSKIDQIINELPCFTYPISVQTIQQHMNGNLYLRDGRVFHIGLMLEHLYPNGLDQSNIVLVEPTDKFKLELLLQGGCPIGWYRHYLLKTLAAKILPSPINIEQLIKLSLVVGQLNNPTSLTMMKTNKTWNFNPYITWTNDQETLCLFLDDGQDIGIATAFWNCRRLLRKNKIFLPREAFLNNLDHHASLIIEFMPSIRALFITTTIEREDAIKLYQRIKNVFEASGRNLCVKVCYRDFRFDVINAGFYSGGDNTFSRLINTDGSVYFEPPIPFGHENTGFAFGYDAEVRFKTGRKLALPATRVASILLTNELSRIQKAEKNGDNLGQAWLRRKLPVRTEAKGITGIALAGKECQFFIHADDIVITRRLKEAGFEVRLNAHTRYAQGFVKRIGGFEKAISILAQRGSDIISALIDKKADRRGLYKQQIIDFLDKNRGLNKKEAERLLQDKLPLLLENGLIRRGYSPCCPTCNLTDWYPLEEVREFIECRGCAEFFLLPLHGLQFTYKANELAACLIEEGGLAVLMTAALFYYIPHSGFIHFGGELLRPGEKQNFAEIDLFWLTSDALIIAECKSYYNIDQKGLDEIQNSLNKSINAANLIDAQVIILGVVTHSSNLADLFVVVADAAQKARNQGIGLHLALNGKLHLEGNENGTEPWKVGLEELLVYDNPQENEWFIGESPQQFSGFNVSNEFIDHNVLHRWEQEMGIE